MCTFALLHTHLPHGRCRSDVSHQEAVMGLFRRAGDKAANDSMTLLNEHNLPGLPQVGIEKLFTSAIPIKPVILMPTESIVLVLRSFSLTCTQNALCGEQCFGVIVLNRGLITSSLAECFQCLCNFPFLTWESIPYKMLNMPYKKQSMFYIAFLFCI